MTVPAYLPFSVLAGTAAVAVAIVYGLHRALDEAGWSRAERVRDTVGAALILLLWLVGGIALGACGVFHATSSELPTIPYGIVLPILIGALLIWRSPLVARIIDAVPQSWLVGIQLYRVIGAIFLILYAAGELPAFFAWPAGIGDIIVGLLAPILASRYARAPVKYRGPVLAWNVFGLADLVVAVAAGALSAPSVLQVVATEPPNELITLFPLVIIPIFFVPLSTLLHIASLMKLRRSAT